MCTALRAVQIFQQFFSFENVGTNRFIPYVIFAPVFSKLLRHTGYYFGASFVAALFYFRNARDKDVLSLHDWCIRLDCKFLFGTMFDTNNNGYSASLMAAI